MKYIFLTDLHQKRELFEQELDAYKNKKDFVCKFINNNLVKTVIVWLLFQISHYSHPVSLSDGLCQILYVFLVCKNSTTQQFLQAWYQNTRFNLVLFRYLYIL